MNKTKKITGTFDVKSLTKSSDDIWKQPILLRLRRTAVPYNGSSDPTGVSPITAEFKCIPVSQTGFSFVKQYQVNLLNSDYSNNKCFTNCGSLQIYTGGAMIGIVEMAINVPWGPTSGIPGVINHTTLNSFIREFNPSSGEGVIEGSIQSIVNNVSLIGAIKIDMSQLEMSYQTDSYANSNVLKATNTYDKKVWKKTQIRNIDNLVPDYSTLSELFREDTKDTKGVNKVNKLLTSLTGNNFVKGSGPAFQTGRYVVCFNDMTSFTFNTGFNSNYGFGTYVYSGLAHGFSDISGIKMAKLFWESQASGSSGKDKWNVYYNDIPTKAPTSVSNFTFESDAYNNSNVISNVSTSTSNGSGVWLRTQIRNISNSSRGPKNLKLITSLTGNNNNTKLVLPPAFQTGRYCIYFNDFNSIVFETGFNSKYPFGKYHYTGIVNGTGTGPNGFGPGTFAQNYGKCRFAKISWEAQSSSATGTDNWSIDLLEPKTISNNTATVKFKLEGKPEPIDNEQNANNPSNVYQVTRIGGLSVLSTDTAGKIFMNNFKNVKALSSTEACVAINAKYSSSRYVIYLDDFTSVSFMTAFGSDFKPGNYYYTGIVSGTTEYNYADIKWKVVDGKKDTITVTFQNFDF